MGFRTTPLRGGRTSRVDEHHAGLGDAAHREIGLEKTLDARRRDILFQFLAEAMAITFAGGLLGIMVAYLISWSVGRIRPTATSRKTREGGDIRLIISPVNLVVSTTISW